MLSLGVTPFKHKAHNVGLHGSLHERGVVWKEHKQFRGQGEWIPFLSSTSLIFSNSSKSTPPILLFSLYLDYGWMDGWIDRLPLASYLPSYYSSGTILLSSPLVESLWPWGVGFPCWKDFVKLAIREPPSGLGCKIKHIHIINISLRLSVYSQPTAQWLYILLLLIYTHRLLSLGPPRSFLWVFARVWVPCKLVVAVDNLRHVPNGHQSQALR